jgi:NTE family protein
MAIQFYDRNIFHGATFADMRRVDDAPLILINASDLGYGVRFSFIQEYFDLLCSDVSTFPVARAVAASSAVPVLFNPVVVRNYADCKQEEPEWLRKAMVRAEQDPQLEGVARGLATYYDSEKRQYAHFVDGGITDNLGLRASYEVFEVSGDIKGFYARHRGRPLPSHFAFISVDAATDPEPEMDTSNKQPSIAETVSAMSDIQLHRYNTATLALMKNTVARWAETLSTPDHPIAPHFAYISFSDLPPSEQPYFNEIPTSFSLSDEQVDRLISAGRELLRNNPDFQRLLRQLEAG